VHSFDTPSPLSGKGVLGLDSYLFVQILLCTKNSRNYFTNMAESISEVLEHLLQLNVDFQVLVYLGEECQCAVSPGVIVQYLQRYYQTRKELRQVLEQYIQRFSSLYNYLTVQLLLDRSSPQSGLQIIDRFQCKQCEFKS